ncbi:MAG: glycosyltransferase family 4 protein [bacterium]|nr:glycosyltransferase family 4 protein [bacterium]
MKILQITHDFLPNPLWGVGYHVNDLIEGLAESGNDIVVVTRNRFDQPIFKKIKNIIVFRSPFKLDEDYLVNKKVPFDSYKNPKTLKKFYDEYFGIVLDKLSEINFQPQVVHNHTWHSFDCAFNIANFYGVPLVSTIHILETQFKKISIHPAFEDLDYILRKEREVFLRSDKLVCLSRGIKNDLIKLYPFAREKVTVIESGIKIQNSFNRSTVQRERRKYLSAKKNQMIILFVGRLVEEKGVIYLVETIKKFYQECSKLVFVFAGDGPLKKLLEDNLKGIKNIFFLGKINREEIFLLYKLADILIIPSLTESCSLVLLEALGSKVPIITTNNEGVKTLISRKAALIIGLKEKGEKRFLDIYDIESAISKLSKSLHLRLSLRREAYNIFLKRFDYKIMSSRLETLYKRLIISR